MSSIDDLYKNKNLLQSSIAYQNLLEFQNQLTQKYSPIFEMKDQYDTTAAVTASQMAEQICNSFLLPFSEALSSLDYQQQVQTIQNSISTFASNIASINIHPTYVSVPEAWIPDDFPYEEIAEDSINDLDKSEESTTVVKRLSFDKALEFLKSAITVMQAIKLFTELSPSAIQNANKALEYLLSIYQTIKDRLS